MKPSRVLLWASLGLLGCDRAEPPREPLSAENEGSLGASGEPAPASPPPSAEPSAPASPLPTSASPDERREAVVALLAGGEAATRLPVVATDSGKPLDEGLRARLLPSPKGLPPEVIQRVVRASFGRYRTCYEAGLKRKPDLAGRVVVSFAIDVAGRVKEAEGDRSDLAEAEVVRCIVEAFGTLSFPAPGEEVRVSFPIVFAPD